MEGMTRVCLHGIQLFTSLPESTAASRPQLPPTSIQRMLGVGVVDRKLHDCDSGPGGKWEIKAML